MQFVALYNELYTINEICLSKDQRLQLPKAEKKTLRDKYLAELYLQNKVNNEQLKFPQTYPSLMIRWPMTRGADLILVYLTQDNLITKR